MLFYFPGLPGDLLCQGTKNIFLIVTGVCSEVAETDTRHVYPVSLHLSEFLETEGNLQLLAWLEWLAWLLAALGQRSSPSGAVSQGCGHSPWQGSGSLRGAAGPPADRGHSVVLMGIPASDTV